MTSACFAGAVCGDFAPGLFSSTQVITSVGIPVAIIIRPKASKDIRKGLLKTNSKHSVTQQWHQFWAKNLQSAKKTEIIVLAAREANFADGLPAAGQYAKKQENPNHLHHIKFNCEYLYPHPRMLQHRAILKDPASFFPCLLPLPRSPMHQLIVIFLWLLPLQIAAGQRVIGGGVSDVISAPVKSVTEYPLPAAGRTHEIIAVNDNLLLISQQTDGSLVKVVLDDLGRPTGSSKWTIVSPFSGLHGLALHAPSSGGSGSGSGNNSTQRTTVWATVQFDSAILRIDPGENDVNSPPRIVDTIPIPSPAYGPHGIIENDGNLWIGCKDSSHVVRINAANPSDSTVYPVSQRPIFVAVHPTSKDVYASLDLSSKIWHLKGDGSSEEIDVSSKGATPVGLVAGSDGNAWVVLLGTSTGGNGTFGRINEDASITWFTFSSNSGKTAPIIHLAFDSDPSRFWLLGSSTISPSAINAVFTVKIDNGESSTGAPPKPRIAVQTTITMPTQWSSLHRIISHRGGLYVTEYTVSSLAHITGAAVNGWNVSETWDQYADSGQGIKAPVVYYNNNN